MTMKRIKANWSRRASLSLPAIALALGGCGDDSQADNTTPPTGSTDPAYAISALIASADMSMYTDYVKIVPSLDEGTMVDESKTIEATSTMPLYGLEGSGEFFLAAGDKGEITKYTIGSDLRAEQGETISFAGYGVNRFGIPPIAFASKTKAYVMDEWTYQGFVWDPSTMTIVSNVDLSSQFQNKEGDVSYWTQFEVSPSRVGNKFYLGFLYWDPLAFKGPSRSGVLVIDSDKDTFTVVHHPTCGGLFNTMVGEDGFVYVGTYGGQAAAYRVGAVTGAAPCLVRIDPKTDTYDETFQVDLAALTGGRTAAGIVENSGSFGYIRVLNEDLINDGVLMAGPIAASSWPAWETYRIDLANPTSVTLVDTPVSSSEFYVSRTGGRVLISQTDWAAGKSVLLDMSQNPPAPALATTGWVNKMLRVQ